MPHSTQELPKFSLAIDTLIKRIGSVTYWLNSVLAINIVVQVILRYALGEGKIWLEEMEWHLYAVLLLMGLSYCLVTDKHVRLDIFHRQMSPAMREWVDLLGMLLLVLPLFLILFFHGIGFFATAWNVNESSPHPLGLPYWWIIKGFIPLTMLLVILAAVSRIVRAVAVLLRLKQEKSQG
jgi:TRAP-type mannitol/chloroaromatic compound transport system permease small subunit